MMTVAQIVKHIDNAAPVRFLIAETESGYTLLAALWLARLFGIEKHVEISPLFETAEALEHGERVLEEALRSPHFRAYLQSTGRLALAVRLLGFRPLCRPDRRELPDRAAAAEDRGDARALRREGRGSGAVRYAWREHRPGRASRLARRSAEIPLAHREPAGAQQGLAAGARGDGVPGRRRLPAVRHAGTGAGDGRAHRRPRLPPGRGADRRPDLRRSGFRGRLLRDRPRRDGRSWSRMRAMPRCSGAFGPALLDPTGSRPAARQAEGMGAAGRIRHPRELRAIPNNAILQQLGWCANTLQGLGAAAARHPEAFPELRENSRRFRRALDLPAHALAHSDLDVLRAVIGTLDPGSWLDRAAHTRRPGRREALVAVARALERLDLWAAAQSMFRRIQADHLALRVGLARCAADADARGAAARAAAHADPADLAARDRDPGLLAAPRLHAAGSRSGDPASRRRAGAGSCWPRYFRPRPTPPPSATTPSRAARAARTPMRASTRRSSTRSAACLPWCGRSATAVTHEVGAFG